ncbi:MAG: exodeoxyribonuclease III [Corynebacterium sp.]|nr:exodeoxyribonuclease III [Corynebacterium sp.]
MRVATWNINSVRTRIDRVVAALERHDIDVLALQETKCKNEQFPFEPLEAAGYKVAHFGLNQWNGVALISRVGLEHVRTEFPYQPGFAKDPAKPQNIEARAVGAVCAGVEMWSLYVPNGREITDRHYQYKLRWLSAFADYIRYREHNPFLCMGDFNIAPKDDNVWDPTFFAGKTHITEPERQAFAALMDAGLRVASPQQGYSYWDYTAGRWPNNEGMLIDFQLTTPDLPVEHAWIDVAEREGKGASDHTLVIVDYDWPAPRQEITKEQPALFEA